MTIHLRMAAVGFCAALLPACSMNGKLVDDSRTATAPNYVVLPRAATSSSTGLRNQIASGQGVAGSKDPALRQPFGPGASSDLAVAEPPKISSRPPTDLAMPPIPDAPSKITSTIAAQPVPGMKDAEAIKPTAGPALPIDPAPANALTGPRSLPASTEPMRVPDWPQFDQPVAPARALTLPDTAPVLEPAAATGPPLGTTAMPPADLAPPRTIQQSETTTSLKLSAPPALPTVPPAPALPVETVAMPSAPAASPAPMAATVADTVLFQALRAFQNNEPQEALEHLKKLDATNQELLMYLLPLMVRLADGDAKALPPEELATMIDRLQTASSMLKSRATLRADRICFCRSVRRFADVDPYEASHEFRPGDMVFLYAELKNFTCELVSVPAPAGAAAPAQGWRIRLAPKLEIRDASNNLVWRTDLNKTDFAQSPPQDYYHTYRFCVPDKMPPGVYTFWLTIVDKPTGRTVRKPVEMRIGKS